MNTGHCADLKSGMTDDQFAALATLIGLKDSPSARAARRVLVGGMKMTEAARLEGVSQPSVSITVKRCRAAIELAAVVAGS